MENPDIVAIAVQHAIDALPDEIARRIDNVAVEIAYVVDLQVICNAETV